jgi:hypothetical protein
MQNHIEWTKEFHLDHQKGAFKIYISCHKNKQMFGGIVYYEKSGSFTKDNAEIDLKLHNIIGQDESSLLDLCKKWVDENLGVAYKITKN